MQQPTKADPARKYPRCKCGGSAQPREVSGRMVWKCRNCNATVEGPPLKQPQPAPVTAAKPQCNGKNDAPKEKKKFKRSAGHRDKQMAKRGRLPDLSTFHVTYNAGDQKWQGSLIFAEDSGLQSFHHVAEGVFRLLEELDTKYREWLKAQQQPAQAKGETP